LLELEPEPEPELEPEPEPQKPKACSRRHSRMGSSDKTAQNSDLSLGGTTGDRQQGRQEGRRHRSEQQATPRRKGAGKKGKKGSTS